MATILVTGAAGFIGSHVAQQLLARGEQVVGLDNLNAYYDVTLKEARLARLVAQAGFTFARLDLTDRTGLAALFAQHRFDGVVHLAAQAGVRYSLEDPHAYIAANLDGFVNILESCRRHPPQHLVYASTSSVYGANTKMPFAETDNTDHPLSLYAATKKANEAIAHSYAALFGFPCTGLRFFTVYGPWGRPDMALFGFTKKILAGEPIPVFNYGKHRRDFTYIDDIVDGIVRVLDRPATPDPAWDGATQNAATSRVPWRLYNIGNAQPVELIRYIEVLEECLGRKAERELLPLQPGDVPDTWADVSALAREVGYTPSTPVEVGVARFVAWYRQYYGV